MISFKGRHFPKDVILMGIRWYISYPQSYRHVEELMEERGVKLDHATVNRWVVNCSPALEANFRKYKKPVGRSWRMDETYIKVMTPSRCEGLDGREQPSGLPGLSLP